MQTSASDYLNGGFMLGTAHLLSNFGADIHVSLKATRILSIGPLHFTNAMLWGLICAGIIGFMFLRYAKTIGLTAPKGPKQIPEMLVEHVIGILEGSFGSRQKAIKYAPVFSVFFVFIILNNLFGLIPIVGPGLYVSEGGLREPLLRPFTADLNGTIALAVIAIIIVQVLSIRAQGGKKHLQHYFSDKPHNPLNLFIGILEVFGEFTRIISLSLRLFLNTAVGEILVAVFTSMIAGGGRTPVAALPIFLFEMLVAYIQAYVFTVLCATYLAQAIAHADHDDHHTDTEHSVVAAKS